MKNIFYYLCFIAIFLLIIFIFFFIWVSQEREEQERLINENNELTLKVRDLKIENSSLKWELKNK